MPQSVWLVTATTSGLGAAVVQNLTVRGDKVMATGRGATERLKHLQSDDVFLLDLDITAPRTEINEKIKEAWDVWGRIDVLLNNAGISAPKSIEEADDDFVRNVFDVNLFGTLHVTQAILPYFRAQKSGTIAFIGAGVGWGPLPFLGHYAASKVALGAFVECLTKELGQPREGSVEGFGKYKPAIDVYNPGFEELMDVFTSDIGPNVPGDISKLSERIVDCVKVKGASAGRPEPVRVILGSDALRLIEQKCKEQLELGSSWEDVSLSTDRDEHDHVIFPAEQY
ncbi:3-oxoacyl-(acyl-carrier-) reductase [Fusarium agapanthi]|uniref:3-oxoacyl-(Acyl-carrier-) reductase n=1 Tax=Fusarium agapanthi TaxID=1803897 RepID=A0A9P5AXF8_9HYPO|nr:3-oxoacyl-(acyl-carrier-) reductase [Fusarium agapanthi]